MDKMDSFCFNFGQLIVQPTDFQYDLRTCIYKNLFIYILYTIYLKHDHERFEFIFCRYIGRLSSLTIPPSIHCEICFEGIYLYVYCVYVQIDIASVTHIGIQISAFIRALINLFNLNNKIQSDIMNFRTARFVVPSCNYYTEFAHGCLEARRALVIQEMLF